MEKDALAGGGTRGGTGWLARGCLEAGIVANGRKGEGAVVMLEGERRREVCVCGSFTWLGLKEEFTRLIF